MPALHLAQDADSDALLSANPLALLIGMVLDQQVTIEKAFSSPAELARRLDGPLDAASIAAMDPDHLSELFRRRPALHRFPGSMATRVQEVCNAVATTYGNRTERIWQDARDGRDLVERLRSLPGFGEQKAKIFTALLGKQLGVRPPGWQEASVPYGDEGTHLSVADITGPETLDRVRSAKKALKVASRPRA